MLEHNSIEAREKQFHNERYAHNIDPRDELQKYYAITSASNERFHTLILENASRDCEVLEYGCGTGGDIKLLDRIGCNMHAIDISEEAIKKASESAAAQGVCVEYKVGNAENTPYETDAFDIVIGNGILHHLNLEKSSRELARIIKPNGAGIFSEPLGHNPLINMFRRATPKLRSPDEHPLVMPDIALLKRYFGKVSVDYFYLFALAAVPFRKTRMFPSVYNGLIAVDKFLFRHIPFLQRYAWICIISLQEPLNS